jgi:hypothetical protein
MNINDNRSLVVLHGGDIMHQGRFILQWLLSLWNTWEDHGEEQVHNLHHILNMFVFHLEDNRVPGVRVEGRAAPTGFVMVHGWEFLAPDHNLNCIVSCCLNSKEENCGSTVQVGPGDTGAQSEGGREIWRVIPAMTLHRTMTALLQQWAMMENSDREEKVFNVQVKRWDVQSRLVLGNMFFIWRQFKLDVQNATEASFFEFIDCRLHGLKCSVDFSELPLHSIEPVTNWIQSATFNKHGGLQRIDTEFTMKQESSDEEEDDALDDINDEDQQENIDGQNAQDQRSCPS